MLSRVSVLLLHCTQACMLFQSNKMVNEVESLNIHTAGSQGEQTSGSGQFIRLPKQQLNGHELNGPLVWFNGAFLMRAWFCSAIFFRSTQGFTALCYNWILMPEKLWEGCAHRPCLLGRQSDAIWKGAWHQNEAVLLTCPRYSFYLFSKPLWKTGRGFQGRKL